MEAISDNDRPTVPVLDPTATFLAGVDAWGMTSDVEGDAAAAWWRAQRRRWLAIWVGAFVALCLGVLVVAFVLAARSV
jgi:hypothetical protein